MASIRRVLAPLTVTPEEGESGAVLRDVGEARDARPLLGGATHGRGHAALETAIAQMTSQSDWLAHQLRSLPC